MNRPPISEELRRFILTSVPSVPFLEALLLLRASPGQHWSGAMLARRLYIAERTAQGGTAIAAYEFEWQGEIFRIGASIGQLEFGDGKLSAYELLYRADEMCYLAKSRGRDRVVSFSRERNRTGNVPKNVAALRSNRQRIRRPRTPARQ